MKIWGYAFAIAVIIAFQEEVYSQRIHWSKKYPQGTSVSYFVDLEIISDSTYLLAGSVIGSSNYPELIWVDSSGNWQYSEQFVFSTNGQGNSWDLVKIPFSDQFYFLGTSDSNPHSFDFVCKIEPNGDTIRCARYRYQGVLYETVRQGLALPDGSIISAGRRQFAGTGMDLVIRRVDSSGFMMYDRSYPIPQNQNVFDLIEAYDGSFIISGSTGGEHHLFRVSLNGNILHDTLFDIGAGGIRENNLALFPDKSILFSGINLVNWPIFNSKLIRFNSNFGFQWQESHPSAYLGLMISADSGYVYDKYYGGSSLDLDIEKAFDTILDWTLSYPSSSITSYGVSGVMGLGNGRAIIYGQMDSTFISGSYFLSKISGVGEPWIPDPCQLSPQAPGFSWTYDAGVLVCTDTSFAGLKYHDSVYHYSWSATNGFSSDSSVFYSIWDTSVQSSIDVTLVIENFYRCKDTITVTLNKHVNGIISHVYQEFEVFLYPNPAKDYLDLEVQADHPMRVQGSVSLHDLNGKEMFSEEYSQPNSRFFISELPPGIYIAKVQVNGQQFFRKIIKR